VVARCTRTRLAFVLLQASHRGNPRTSVAQTHWPTWPRCQSLPGGDRGRLHRNREAARERVVPFLGWRRRVPALNSWPRRLGGSSRHLGRRHLFRSEPEIRICPDHPSMGVNCAAQALFSLKPLFRPPRVFVPIVTDALERRVGEHGVVELQKDVRDARLACSAPG